MTNASCLDSAGAPVRDGGRSEVPGTPLGVGGAAPILGTGGLAYDGAISAGLGGAPGSTGGSLVLDAAGRGGATTIGAGGSTVVLATGGSGGPGTGGTRSNAGGSGTGGRAAGGSAGALVIGTGGSGNGGTTTRDAGLDRPPVTPDAGPPLAWSSGVTIRLDKTLATDVAYASFGLPLPEGTVADASTIRVMVHGNATPIAGVNLKVLLREHDADGNATGVRAVLVQIPAASVGDAADVDIVWSGTGTAPGATLVPYNQVSAASAETVETAERTITRQGSTCSLVETATATKTLFTSTEPVYLATFPDGYLASTAIIGKHVPRSQVTATADLAGVKYMSDSVIPFALSAMYQETYRLNPSPESVIDPVADENYEGWLYDRCTTFLSFYTHTSDARFLREAYRNCSYYASKINQRGIFTGKPEADTKYSHLRGLYAYYALTGDELAMTAGRAIATMWLNEEDFVAPYRAGAIGSEDQLWTERLLGTSMEGLYYGLLLLDDKQYLTAFREMFKTAYTHITTPDAATLNAIIKQNGTSAYPNFPPQNCFVHNAEQAAEGNGSEPWCSGWMTELLIDVLLTYQHDTNDTRVDEIFVRLARFLRDVGSSYFFGNPTEDYFLKPSVCYDPSDGLEARTLIPLYGAGLFPNGSRFNAGDYDDTEHCSDATALMAVALRSLKRLGLDDTGGPIGPFATEGESFVQMFHEFSVCAKSTFANWDRSNRDPANHSSSDLCDGVSNPASYITENKVGYPSHPSNPQRKLSWWFNMSLLQFGMLQEAGVAVPSLHPGTIQPAGQTCP